MKNTIFFNGAAKVSLLPVIIAIAAVIGFLVMGCDDGGASCSHAWKWKVTTQAAAGAPGLETEICSKCGVKSGKTKHLEQLTNSGSGNDEGLTSGGAGSDEGLASGGAGNDEGLASGGAGNDEGLTSGGAGNDKGLASGGSGNDEGLASGGAGNDEPLTSSKSDNDEGLASGGLTVINISVIHGVYFPEDNISFPTVIDETDQYTGTVRWRHFPAGNYIIGGSFHFVIITLNPKEGYTLQGVSENFFTIAGTSSQAFNEANSGFISFTFTDRTKDYHSINEKDLSNLMINNADDNKFTDRDSTLNRNVIVFPINTANEWEEARQSIITGREGSSYIINIKNDLIIAGANKYNGYTFGSVKDVNISICGSGVLALSNKIGNGALLRINEYQTVDIDNITLKGILLNNDALVTVANNGTFIMYGGKITGNRNVFGLSEADGGGVRNSGMLIMYGGEICNNEAVNTTFSSLGGGVLNQGGYFIMYDGKIANNTAGGSNPKGGGIANISGIIRIVSGMILGNEIKENGNYASSGAALFKSCGLVEYGYFNEESGEWVNSGKLITRNSSIYLYNGILAERYI